MINVVELVDTKRLSGNYFAPSAYVRCDLELGLLENRQGERLLALPDNFLQGIYAGLEAETGQAARLVLFNCGRWWGKNFYGRFCEEIVEYYNKPLEDMMMVEFLQCFRQCWNTLGWGDIELNRDYYNHGFLEVKLWNSAFAESAPAWKRPVCFLEAGILKAFFCNLTNQDLHCVQIACESLGAECNRFLLGLPERLKPAEAWVEEGVAAEDIMARLLDR